MASTTLGFAELFLFPGQNMFIFFSSFLIDKEPQIQLSPGFREDGTSMQSPVS